MSIFLKSGKTFKVTTEEAIDCHSKLPVGTYNVGFDPDSGQFYLETINPFEINGKLYGDTNIHANRILSTFQDRSVSTGVLLTGEKGSGKTMLAKRISILCADMGIPTIVVNQPWHGENFNSFLQRIEQPTVMIFDEFEKTYAVHSKQEALLTLLDGVYPSKKLFLLTCNDKWRINSHMRNRPGRIFYSIDYHGLEMNFIEEYCSDHLKNKNHITLVCATSHVFSAFNFDMLKALVEEMNRYDETPAEALKFLNANPIYDANIKYTTKLMLDGKEVTNFRPKSWTGVPMKSVIQMTYGDKHQTASFSAQEFHHVDPASGAFVFRKRKSNLVLTIEPKASHAVDFQMVQNLKISDENSSTTAPDEIDSDVDGESIPSHVQDLMANF